MGTFTDYELQMRAEERRQKIQQLRGLDGEISRIWGELDSVDAQRRSQTERQLKALIDQKEAVRRELRSAPAVDAYLEETRKMSQ